MIQNILGYQVDFTRHPNFDLNQQKSVSGEETIKNDADKVNYRRIYDQFEAAKPIILTAQRGYEEQIERAQQTIRSFGAQTLSKNAR